MNWRKSSWHEVTSLFFATNTSDWPHWDLNSCFCAIRTIWVHLAPFSCLTKLGEKWAEVVQKFVPWSHGGIFHNEPLDPPYWTLTSFFGAFHTIWVHLGPFGCLTKIGAKRAEMVQKFVPWSRGRMFRNERTRSTPLDSKHMFCVFCTIWMYLEPFGCLTKLSAKRPELVQKFVPRSSCKTAMNTPDWPCWDLNSCYGAFRTIWVHLVPFGRLTKLGAKRAKVLQKFVPWSRVGFRNEPIRSTPLDPNLIFWCILYYLGAFGTVWLRYTT